MSEPRKPVTHMNMNGMGDLLGMEVVTIGAQTESLATAGATLPTGTTRIVCQAAEALHWTPVGSATSTYQHAVAAANFFTLEHHQLASEIIDDTPGDQSLKVMYFGRFSVD